ncbi:MAG: hypothetical protein VXX99_02795, partial [Bacteroidota bacterium]|nr:hypothetical protein [Bacteroidota bacterium]
MFSNTKKISRADFFKTSRAVIGGVVTITHFSCSWDLNSLKELMIGGKINFSLVVPTQASAKENNAAQELQIYLSKISKILKLVNEEKYSGDNAIYLGNTDFAKVAGVGSASLAEDAYIFKLLDNNLIIAGGGENGLLNGVYSLLEFFGFRKYSAD